MRIVVLIKPVPDSDATDGWSLGSLDLYALSHGIALRDAAAGSVTVLALGPKASAGILQRALASGADDAIHLQTEDLHQRSGFDIARDIRNVLADEEFDLILAGQSSDDIETGTVGPLLAEMLDIPHVSTVTTIRPDGGGLLVDRDAVGSKQRLKVPIPAMLLILSGRDIALKYPTPRGMIGARKKQTRVVEVQARQDSSGIAWSDARLPERSNDGEMLVDLSPVEAAKRIVAWLQERGLTG
jgi:electron transfer flavoprotein beta subunit